MYEAAVYALEKGSLFFASALATSKIRSNVQQGKKKTGEGDVVQENEGMRETNNCFLFLFHDEVNITN